MQVVPEARGVVRFLDGRNTAAVHLASSLEALSTTQRTAAAKNVPPEQYAAVRQLLHGVEYHAGAQVRRSIPTGHYHKTVSGEVFSKIKYNFSFDTLIQKTK